MIQRRARISRHPPRIASRNGGGASSTEGSATIGRSRDRNSTLTANEAASKSIAVPTPKAAMSTPAIAGPAMLAAEKLSPRSALAGCSCPGCETVWGSSPVNAGWKNASAVAVERRQHAERHGRRRARDEQRRAGRLDDQPGEVRRDQHAAPVAAVRQHAADEREDQERDELRGTTRPTAPSPPPASSTANGSATSMTRSPMIDSTWPPNSRRNCGSTRRTSGIRGHRDLAPPPSSPEHTAARSRSPRAAGKARGRRRTAARDLRGSLPVFRSSSG